MKYHIFLVIIPFLFYGSMYTMNYEEVFQKMKDMHSELVDEVKELNHLFFERLGILEKIVVLKKILWLLSLT